MTRNVGFVQKNTHTRGDAPGYMGQEVDSFTRHWARGGDAVSTPSGWPTSVGNVNGQFRSDRGAALYSSRTQGFLQEVISLGGATSVLSTNNLLPANSIIEFIVCTPVQELTTPVNYDVGDSTSPTRFATALTNDGSASLTAAQFAKAHWAGTVAITQAAAGKVKLRPNAAGSGKILVTVWYRQFAGSLS